MVRWFTFVRVVALCLLVLSGAEVFACELVAGVSCELSGAPGTQQAPNDDHCLCCCYHVVLPPPPDLQPSADSTPNHIDTIAAGPTRVVSAPERPPRS